MMRFLKSSSSCLKTTRKNSTALRRWNVMAAAGSMGGTRVPSRLPVGTLKRNTPHTCLLAVYAARRCCFLERTLHVRILPFGVLKDSLGPDPFALDWPGGATVADLLARLGVPAPAVASLRIAVGVILRKYAGRSQVLRENDEVGLLHGIGRDCPSGRADPNEPQRRAFQCLPHP